MTITQRQVEAAKRALVKEDLLLSDMFSDKELEALALAVLEAGEAARYLGHVESSSLRLPDCITPSGGKPCVAYAELRHECAKLRSEVVTVREKDEEIRSLSACVERLEEQNARLLLDIDLIEGARHTPTPPAEGDR